ncbi:MAG TPA: protease pro-enzyme activation domain-containing protein [Terracidiphilus sp.]|jgi:subtilase family serine protease
MTTISPLLRRSRLLAAAGLLVSSVLFAQSPAPRIHTDINSSQTTILQGSRHPLANPRNDAGRLAGGTRLNGVTLYFKRSDAQEADLQKLLAAQQNPASPQYHEWLTPAQFGARYGMAQQDIDKVQGWLERQGFSVDSVMHSRTGIRFSGSVSQVESAFQTQMHYYTLRGEKHFAASTDLTVPSALAGVLSGVRNLDDFRPRAQHIVSRHNFTSGSSGNVFFAPPDIVTAYNIQPVYSAGIDGTGQTIAIMGQSWVDVSDVEAFQSAAGLTKKDPQLVLVPGTGNDGVPSAGDESESDLDLEWSGSVAPGANVVFVYTGSDTSFGVFDSAQYAVDNMIGNIISLSYSSCETEISGANGALATLEQIFSQAAAQGQTVMAASGDEGSTSCFGDSNLSTSDQEAVAVNYPASSAYVTAVGGTEATSDDINGGANYATYWNSTAGTDLTGSLIKYMPEVAWNDDPTSGCSSGQDCLSASGGGASSLVAQPSWQTGYFSATGEVNPASAHRLVPDISFYSSPGLPGYLYCTSDTSAWDQADGQVGSCNSTASFRDSASGLLTVAGGTSFATPIFAGMVALLNQSGNYVSGSGEVNQTLYSLGAAHPEVFHDVTSGNNNCLTPQDCSATTGFSAKAGYDEVTGLGSFDLNAVRGVWPSKAGSLIATTTTVVPANATVDANTNDVFTISVSGASGGTPTGSVTLQIDGGTTFGGTTLTNQALGANGTVTYTANFSVAGTHQVVAQYPGDATHAASTGVGEVVITGGGSGKGTIGLASSNITVTQGNTGTSTITVTPAAGYTGTVVLNIDFGSADSTLGNLCYSFTTMDNNGNGTVQVTGASAVTTSLSLDTNASDCAATAAVKKPGTHLMRLRSGATHAGNQPHGSLPAGLAFAGLLLVGFLGRHSRKLRNLACVLALVAIGFAVSACGSSGGGSSNNDPPKGTYTGTVTGTDSVTSTITAKSTFSFTIN